MNRILEPCIRYSFIPPTEERQCLSECAHISLLTLVTDKCINLQMQLYQCLPGLVQQKGSRFLRLCLLHIETNSGALSLLMFVMLFYSLVPNTRINSLCAVFPPVVGKRVLFTCSFLQKSPSMLSISSPPKQKVSD